MGFIAKAKTNTTSTTTTNNSENRGMGFLLVFFPEDNNHNNNNNNLTPLSPNNTTRLIRRTNSSLILTKAQSTISICALLVFLTLLLFTHSTFEPTIPTPTTTTTNTTRRFLSQKNPTLYPNKTKHNTNTSHNSWFLKMWSENPNPKPSTQTTEQYSSIALQRMGTLYRRGTRAMSDLVVAHVAEDVIEDDLRLFLRVLHRSGLTARADIVFIFGSSSLLSRFSSVIQEENESFLKLVHYYKETNNKTQESLLGFDLTQFVKFSKKEMAEPLWGKRIRVNNNNNNNNNNSREIESEGELTRLSYGSVVSFEANELDPEDSLAGFLDHVPMSLRRWACYPMLLGRVRRNFKHVMLVDVKNLVVVGDPLSRVRNRSPESVFISMKQQEITSSNSKHHKKNSDKTQSHCLVNSVVLMGGARGIRRLSNSMLTEIVRGAMQHKKKNSVTESGILSQLVGNGYLLKNINLIKSSESIPDTSSLIGLSSSFATRVDYSIIQRGNSNYYDLNSIIMRQICSCEVDSSVYNNC